MSVSYFRRVLVLASAAFSLIACQHDWSPSEEADASVDTSTLTDATVAPPVDGAQDGSALLPDASLADGAQPVEASVVDATSQPQPDASARSEGGSAEAGSTEAGSADAQAAMDATSTPESGASTCTNCPSGGECREPTCQNGSCGLQNKPAHATCSSGVCNGAGTCIKCVDDTDCKTPGARACSSSQCVQCNDASHCNAANHEVCTNHVCEVGPYCGDRMVNQASEQCDDGNTSNGDACLNTCKNARCGDGFVRLQFEYCEPTVAPHNFWTCNPSTCQASREYAACNEDADCPPSPWQCLNGRCTTMCTDIGQCPPVPVGGGSTACAFFCVNSCMVDGDCAPLHFCNRNAGQSTSTPGFCGPKGCTGGCPAQTKCDGSYCVPL